MTTWNGLCECGHKHSDHGRSPSVNFVFGGRCVKCECKHFLVSKEEFEEQNT